MSDRTYGELTYGDGTYGGPDPVWDTLQGPLGPPGDSDLMLYRPVEGRLIYQSGYSDYPGFGYGTAYRDRQGVCHLNTTMLTPASPAAGAIPAYLPPGFWPLNRVMLPIYTGDPATVARLDINNGDGSLQVNSAPLAGTSYFIMDLVWATPVPATYVIDPGALGPMTLTRGAGNTYIFNMGAGRVWDYNNGNPLMRSMPAQSNVSLNGHATAGNWNWIFLTPNAFSGAGFIGCNTVTVPGAVFTTEASVLTYYYQNSAPWAYGTYYWNVVFLGTFQSTAAGVQPTFNDRRWLPYV